MVQNAGADILLHATLRVQGNNMDVFIAQYEISANRRPFQM